MSGEYGSAAERQLEIYEALAESNRPIADDGGAYDAYLARALAHAQVLATLAVAEALEGIADHLALTLDGERAFSVRQAGAVVYREDRP